MVAKKSAAQIRRMQARAAVRGKTYTTPVEPTSTKAVAAAEGQLSQTPQENDEAIQTKLAAAEKLKNSLGKLEENPDNLNSKDRRSAKRRAEAIAAEECGDGISATELFEWYKRQKKKSSKEEGKKKVCNKKGAELSQEDQAKADSAKRLRVWCFLQTAPLLTQSWR